MRGWVFGLFGVASLGLIVAMQRVALHELKTENTALRKAAVASVFAAAGVPTKTTTYVTASDNTFTRHDLPEPNDANTEITARIDMLIDHLRPEFSTLPSAEWVKSVLIAARREIVMLEHNQPYYKVHHQLGHCTR